MMFLALRKLGNICCGHKMFLNKIRNIFCPGHKICVRNKCCARGQTRKHLCRQQCVRDNVSSFASTFIATKKRVKQTSPGVSQAVNQISRLYYICHLGRKRCKVCKCSNLQAMYNIERMHYTNEINKCRTSDDRLIKQPSGTDLLTILFSPEIRQKR